MLPFIGIAQKLERFRAANSRPYGSNATCLEIYKHQFTVSWKGFWQGNAKTPDESGVFTKEERKNEKDNEESFVYIVSRSCEEKKGINIKFL